MKKIVILGCENSHADAFIECVQKRPEFSDIEIMGVYSDDAAAAQKLHSKFSVPVMASYDEAAGQVDGVVITARHGDLHAPFAQPYLQKGVAMFIDKPLTICPREAAQLMGQLKALEIPVVGGSSLRHCFEVQTVRQAQLAQVSGPTVGGVARAPMNSNNPYGGFYFYTAHLVEIVLTAFGRCPNAVQALYDPAGNLTVLFFYGGFTITGLYTEGGGEYYISRFALNGSQGGCVAGGQGKQWYYQEFSEFVQLMKGGSMPLSYSELLAPVAVLEAIDRARKSGLKEAIHYVEV